MRYLLIILCLLIASPCFAERMLVKPDFAIDEIIPEVPDNLNKAELRAELNTHDTLTLVKIMHILANNGMKGTEAQAIKVAEKLIELGDFVTYNSRYTELYPSEETP